MARLSYSLMNFFDYMKQFQSLGCIARTWSSTTTVLYSSASDRTHSLVSVYLKSVNYFMRSRRTRCASELTGAINQTFLSLNHFSWGSMICSILSTYSFMPWEYTKKVQNGSKYSSISYTPSQTTSIISCCVLSFSAWVFFIVPGIIWVICLSNAKIKVWSTSNTTFIHGARPLFTRSPGFFRPALDVISGISVRLESSSTLISSYVTILLWLAETWSHKLWMIS